jgi:hypothetical protein
MPLPPEHLLDELATAYVQIVAAAAGATIAVSRQDYGVDGPLKSIVRTAEGRYVESGFPVDFQLKGTTTAEMHNEHVRYDLRARNYELVVKRQQFATPYYLFLVCFQSGPGEWLEERLQSLILSASAYWWTQTGPATGNASTVRINIPVKNRLASQAIRIMLQASQDRFLP